MDDLHRAALQPPARAAAAAYAAAGLRPGAAPALHAHWARDADEVAQAQRLRHRIFAGEMGARLSVPPGTPHGLDVDRFDAHCEHLLVRAAAADGGPGPVVATCRVLTPAGARVAGALYSDGEFDLAPLQPLRGGLLELGRSCVDAAHRQGGAILLLWAQLAAFMHRNRLRWLIGCASVPMGDGGEMAAALWHTLRETHLAPPAWQVAPRLPLPVAGREHCLPVQPPALIKGYLRCGAQVLGPPACDPEFGTADLPMMLDLQQLPASYRRHFLGA